jgi:hypothetical protein
MTKAYKKLLKADLSGKILMLAVLLMAGLAIATQAQAVTYDLTTDWSDAANPHGLWSYNQGNTPLAASQDNFLFTGQKAWADNPSTTQGFIPFVFKSTTNSSPITSGKVYMHPWDPTSGLTGKGDANITWTSDIIGTAHISGSLWYAGISGRSVDYFLYVNTSQKAAGTIVDGGLYNEGNPLSFTWDGQVALGDVVKLELVRTPGQAYGNTTGVSLSINVPPVPLPPGVWLLGSGLLRLAGFRRRFKG